MIASGRSFFRALRARNVALLAAAFLAAACDNPIEPDPLGPPAAIRVRPNNAPLIRGEQLQFHAELFDARGRRVPDEAVIWESSDTTIARIDAASSTSTSRSSAVAWNPSSVVSSGGQSGRLEACSPTILI